MAPLLADHGAEDGPGGVKWQYRFFIFRFFLRNIYLVEAISFSPITKPHPHEKADLYTYDLYYSNILIMPAILYLLLPHA